MDISLLFLHQRGIVAVYICGRAPATRVSSLWEVIWFGQPSFYTALTHGLLFWTNTVYSEGNRSQNKKSSLCRYVIRDSLLDSLPMLVPSRRCWWTLALRLPTAPFSHQVGLAARVRNLCRRLWYLEFICQDLPSKIFQVMYHNNLECIDWPGCIDSGTKRIPGMATPRPKLQWTLHIAISKLPCFTSFYSYLSQSVSGLSYKNHTKNHTSFWISSQTYPNHPNQASFIMANFSSRVLMKATDWGSGVTWSAWIQNCFAEIRRLRRFFGHLRSFKEMEDSNCKGMVPFLEWGRKYIKKGAYYFILILSLDEIKKLPHLVGRALASIKSFRPSFQHVRQDHTGSSESGMWIVNPRSSGAPSMVGSTLRWSTRGGRPSKYLTRSQGHVLNG